MHICTGLVGPKLGTLKPFGFKTSLKGQSGHADSREEFQVSEPSHFGGTLGSLWVYSGDFGSFYDYFGIIVELLWV